MTGPRNDSSPHVRLSRDPMSWLGRHEFVALLLVLVATAGTWLFASIADRAVADEANSFDRGVLLSMRNPDDHTDPIGPAWVEELGRDFTALGGTGVLTLIALATVGFLLLQGKPRVVLLVVVAVVGGLILSSVLKHLFDRPRPDLVPHGSSVYPASFPSGHSMMSAGAPSASFMTA